MPPRKVLAHGVEQRNENRASCLRSTARRQLVCEGNGILDNDLGIGGRNRVNPVAARLDAPVERIERGPRVGKRPMEVRHLCGPAGSFAHEVVHESVAIVEHPAFPSRLPVLVELCGVHSQRGTQNRVRRLRIERERAEQTARLGWKALDAEPKDVEPAYSVITGSRQLVDEQR